MPFTKHNSVQLEKIADKATRWIGSTSSLLVHTIIFIVAFLLPLIKVISFQEMLLILTTIVSLEAIYLAIFIQMSVNKNSQDIEIIQEDVGEIQEDIEEIEEDIGEIQKDVDEIQEDIEVETIKDIATEHKEPQTFDTLQLLLLKLQQEIATLNKLP